MILSGVESRRTVSKFTKRKGNSLLYVFTSSIKREIKKFRQKNVQKNVTQVQSCCFVNLLYCLVLPFSLLSPSSLLKLPLDFTKTENILALYVGSLYNYLLLTSLIELFHVTTDCSQTVVIILYHKTFAKFSMIRSDLS